MPRSDKADQELIDLQRAMSVQGTAVAGLPSGAAVAADPEVLAAWQARREAQREAYGQYVANCDISIGNCVAFTPGMQVPLEHVLRFHLVETEQVNRVATPELARTGKVFEADEEFLAANPHVARQAHHLAVNTAGQIDPLDPRGGAALEDNERQAEAGKHEAKPEPKQRRTTAAADTDSKGE